MARVCVLRPEVMGDECWLRAELCGLVARAQGAGPLDSTLYLVPAGVHGLSVEGSWDGLGLRANASAPMMLDDCEVPSGLQLTNDGAGFQAVLDVVLPQVQSGAAAVALGLCRAVVAATAAHLKSARFEHLGQSLERAYRHCVRSSQRYRSIPMASRARRRLVEHLERPRDTTLLRVLETKAAAGEIAIGVTSTADAMLRGCGVLEAHDHRATIPRCLMRAP